MIITSRESHIITLRQYKKVFIKSTFCLFFLLSLLSASTVKAQKLSATLDREKILLGEQITLQLKLEDFNNRTSSINGWVILPDTANHIEFIKRSAIDTVEVTGLSNYIQNIVVTSFDSGVWALPPLQLTVQDKETGKQTVVKAAPLNLEVLPVDVSNMDSYHPIKDIIEVDVANNIWITVAIAAIALISLIALWLLLKNRRKIVKVNKPAIKGSLLEWAMHELDLLKKEDLPAKNEVKLFYTKLDDIYRKYFDEQLQIHTAQLTGDEMMIRLKVYLQQEAIRTQFYQLVRLVNAVKFAKYIPSSTQNDEAIIIAKKTIQHIDQLTQQVKVNNAY